MNISFKSFRQYYTLFSRSVINEIHSMYAGTALGIIWIVLGPMLLLSLYSVIYALIFRVRVPNFTIYEYILNVFSGLVPFLAFAQALSASTTALKAGKSLFFNMNFPTALIAPKYVAVAYVILPVGLVITFLGDLFVSTISWWWFVIPLVAVMQIMFSIGLAYYVSLIALVFRDIQIMVQYIMIALLVITPIAYTPDMIPKGLMALLYANPLFYYVYSYQNIILLNTLPSIDILLIGAFISIFFFYTGLIFFQRVQGALSDLI